MRICVFCGSSTAVSPRYLEVARELGSLCAERGLGLVYGGAAIGMMGAAADGALSRGGEVIGVIPTWLGTKEIAHRGLSELIWVESMAERKAQMFALSDGFISLPGGIGTLDELFEVMTMVALSQFDKPHGIVNTDGYYDGLRDLLLRGVRDGLVRNEVYGRLLWAETPAELVTRFTAKNA